MFSDCALYIITAWKEVSLFVLYIANMNNVLAGTFIFFLVLLFADGASVKYTSKYDNFDIDQVLRNDRLLNYYVKCLLDRGPCSPEGAELKRNLDEALKTGCSKCTEIQKTKSQKALNYIKANKKDIWRELEAKYDPEHSYRARTENKKPEKNGR